MNHLLCPCKYWTFKPYKQPFATVLQSDYSLSFANFTGKHLRWNRYLIKLQILTSGLQLYSKESPTQHGWKCSNFLKHLFYRTLPVAAPIEYMFWIALQNNIYSEFAAKHQQWSSIFREFAYQGAQLY